MSGRDIFDKIYLQENWLRVCVYVFIFLNLKKDFIIQRVKARAIPCPHQLGVSVAQCATDTPGATKQLLPPDKVLRELYVYIYIYIYTPDQLKAETTLDVDRF